MVGVIPKNFPDAFINQHICLARPRSEYSSEYLGVFLTSPFGGLKQLTSIQRGATKVGLTLGDIKSVKFNIPSASEQNEIVKRVDKLFALADKLEAHYRRAMARIEKFPQAILAKAFRGELVPQDPNDEPAEKLLERICRERAGMESVGRAKKKPSVKPKRAKAKAMA
jgi:type I restriction enzyme S subunit